MRHFLVAQGGHGLFDIILRGDKLASYGSPVAPPGEVAEARAMAHYAIAHAETARLSQQNAAKIVHQILLLAFHDEEAIGHQSAEDQSYLLTAGMHGLREFALELLKGEGLEVVELLENISDGWRGKRIYAEFLQRIIRRAPGFSCARVGAWPEMAKQGAHIHNMICDVSPSGWQPSFL